MPVADYTPSNVDVAALLPSRTVDEDGNQLGVFSDKTRVSQTQVNSLINAATLEAFPVFGDDIPDNPGDPDAPGHDVELLRKAATRVVAFRAAALIELTLFPEQVARGNSPYPQYQQSWTDGLKSVGKSIVDVKAGEQPGEDVNSQTTLSGGFDTGFMVGLNTRW